MLATKIHADQLANQLSQAGYPAAALHGDLKQNVRNRTVEQLQRGKIQYLVATDVAARGIDINDITHVINYDLPKFSEDYVHRIGRTGRAGKTGRAISFVLPLDGKHLQKIEKYIGQRLQYSVIEGLEPTKRINMQAQPKSASGARKRFHKNPARSETKKSFTKKFVAKRHTSNDAQAPRRNEERQTAQKEPRRSFSASKSSRNDSARSPRKNSHFRHVSRRAEGA